MGPHTRVCLNSSIFWIRESQVQTPFPSCHMECADNRTERPILQVVTQEKKVQGIQRVGDLHRFTQPLK